MNEAGLLHKLFFFSFSFFFFSLCVLPSALPHTSSLLSPLFSFSLFASVPTVPPGNVQAEAVNSTTVRFTWSAPSPQFINGINQGYKVSAAVLSSGAL